MITEYFKSKGLKFIVEPTDKLFTCVDDGGVESETGEFLYGFIRRLKPQKVLTTGIYTGVSDLYIAQALKENGFGKTTALEFEQFHITRAKELWNKMGVGTFIEPHLTDSLKFEPKEKYQFMFLDTEPFLRFKELDKFYSSLDDGGYVFIHDMPRSLCQGNINPDHPDFKHWPVGEIPQNIINLLIKGELVKFHFGSARGLVGFYKVNKDDYEYRRV